MTKRSRPVTTADLQSFADSLGNLLGELLGSSNRSRSELLQMSLTCQDMLCVFADRAGSSVGAQELCKSIEERFRILIEQIDIDHEWIEYHRMQLTPSFDVAQMLSDAGRSRAGAQDVAVPDIQCCGRDGQTQYDLRRGYTPLVRNGDIEE